MAYDGEAGRQPPASSGLATAVQAHLGRASRFVDGKTRNWSLFFFFRVPSKARLAANLKQIALALDAKAAAGVAPTKLDYLQAPAQLFLDWLRCSSRPSRTTSGRPSARSARKRGIRVPPQVGPDQEAYEFLFQAIEDFSKGAFARLPASFTTPIKADVRTGGLCHAVESQQLQCLRGEIRQPRRCRGAQGVVGRSSRGVRLRTASAVRTRSGRAKGRCRPACRAAQRGRRNGAEAGP